MYVFPAFNQSYKKRKRTFVCCQSCRERRIKCILGKNYERNGCKSCIEIDGDCDLIINRDVPHQPSEQEPEKQKQKSLSIQPSTSKAGSSTNSNTNPNLAANDPITDTHHTAEDRDKDGDKDVYNDEFSHSDNSTGSSDRPPVIPPVMHPPIPPINQLSMGKAEYRNLDPPIIEKLNMMPDNMPSQIGGRLFSAPAARKSYLKMKYNYNISSTLETRFFPVKTIDNTLDDDPLLKVHILTFLETVGVFFLESPALTDEDLRGLLKVYFVKFNSIFPMIHEKTFWEDFEQKEAPTILVFAILMVSVKDKLCEPILKKHYPEIDYERSVVALTDDLEWKVRTGLRMLPGIGSGIKMLCLFFLSLKDTNCSSFQNYKSTSVADLSSCIIYALSLGLNHDDREFSDDASEYRRNVIWCLYFFKLNNLLINSHFNDLKINELKFSAIEATPPANAHLLKLIKAIRPLDEFIAGDYRTSDRIILETDELSLCAQDRPRKVFDVTDNVTIQDIESQLDKYKYIMVYSLSRCIVNTVLILHEVNTTEKNHFSVNGAKNILFYMAQLNPSWIFQSPITMNSLCVSFNVVMKTSKNFYNFTNYSKLLEPYRFKWKAVGILHTRYTDFLASRGIWDNGGVN